MHTTLYQLPAANPPENVASPPEWVLASFHTLYSTASPPAAAKITTLSVPPSSSRIQNVCFESGFIHVENVKLLSFGNICPPVNDIFVVSPSAPLQSQLAVSRFVGVAVLVSAVSAVTVVQFASDAGILESTNVALSSCVVVVAATVPVVE